MSEFQGYIQLQDSEDLVCELNSENIIYLNDKDRNGTNQSFQITTGSTIRIGGTEYLKLIISDLNGDNYFQLVDETIIMSTSNSEWLTPNVSNIDLYKNDFEIHSEDALKIAFQENVTEVKVSNNPDDKKKKWIVKPLRVVG